MRQGLPTGTVTLLFTDIEGSTRLLHELGDAYAAALTEHRLELRRAFAAHAGVEVDTQGDAFFVAFASPVDAVLAAHDAQQALAGGRVRVRMGLHTGTPAVTDEGYVGLDVHRAARIAAAGHGGQVLLSNAVRDQVAARPQLPVALRDLGSHRLKDLSEPERLWQLGLDDFPPLNSLYRANVPAAATSFLGRESDIFDVTDRLSRSRLVTIAGPGGAGKTRLALQVAEALRNDYPSGTWWISLAEVRAAHDVLPAVARALGGASMSPAELVADRELLLVLDNFEHVITAAVEVAELLTKCPRLRVLVTSRERMRLNGEHVHPLGGMARQESRRLFVERAQAASGRRVPDSAEIDTLCARLDDLPLAIELAAARVPTLSPGQLVRRLAASHADLRGGRDSPDRQSSLRATIAWSVDLLDDRERAGFTALGIFRGGWSVEAAQEACGVDLEVLESLVDKSLVRVVQPDRFDMLETIREFAHERLGNQSERLMERLAQHLLRVGAAAGLQVDSTTKSSYATPQTERANIDAVLTWSAESWQPLTGLRLLEAFELYWLTDSLAGLAWLDVLLARAGDELDAASKAAALRLRAMCLHYSGRTDECRAPCEEAHALLLTVGDKAGANHMMHHIAFLAKWRGDLETAEPLARQALENDRRYGRLRDEAYALLVLSDIATAHGDIDASRQLLVESAAAAEQSGFRYMRATALGNLGELFLRVGVDRTVEAGLAEAARDFLEIGHRLDVLLALADGARFAGQRGDQALAATLWGAVVAEDERLTVPAWDTYCDELEEAMSVLIESDELERGLRRGRNLSLAQAVDELSFMMLRNSIDMPAWEPERSAP